jgi:LCP family protein required for cell wall assembly
VFLELIDFYYVYNLYNYRGTIMMSILKNKKARIIIIVLAAIILFTVSTVSGYTYYQLSQVKITKMDATDEDLGINLNTPSNPDEPSVEMDEDIVNIALFGSDRRNSDEQTRTDTIMIATIDKKHKKIKLSSIMRDTYVKINGHGTDKITHAYFFGGPKLAIRTLNENFKMDIRDYVLVDFYSLEKIIDALGGVVIDVKEEEIKSLNACIFEQASYEKKKPTYVENPGPQLLNGMQAVGYGRIRNVGNGDYERTERQRTVLTLLFKKIQSAGPIKFPYVVSQLLPYIETSIDKGTMLKLGAQVFAGGITTVAQERFPLTKASQDTKINGVYYLWADLNATATHIHQFIYDDITPTVAAGDKIQRAPKQQPKITTKNQQPQPKPNIDGGAPIAPQPTQPAVPNETNKPAETTKPAETIKPAETSKPAVG